MTYNNEHKNKKKTVMKNTLIGISKTEQKKTSLIFYYFVKSILQTPLRGKSNFLLSDAGSHLSPKKYAVIGNSDSFRAAKLGQYKI